MVLRERRDSPRDPRNGLWMLLGRELARAARCDQRLNSSPKAAPPPAPLGRTAFCTAHGVHSEAEYKRRRRDEGRLIYHAHLG